LLAIRANQIHYGKNILPDWQDSLHVYSVGSKSQTTPLSKNAIREFEKQVKKGWGEGVSLDELLDRVNRVASKLLPAETGRDSRVSPTVLPRTYRHYTTLGCIDHGRRDGRRVVYGYRHFMQALTVRRLLWERVPAEQIAVLMSGRSTEETQRMFLRGVEVVARTSEDGTAVGPPDPGPVETWRRVQVFAGVELHLRDDLPRPSAADLRGIMERLEVALRRGL
jgi:DNA-binding transcriptional MerR regulator